MHPKAKLKPMNMRRLMLEKNLSSQCLTRRLQISDCYLSQLMRGVRNPSPKLRQRMMNVLEVKEFDDLFSSVK